MAQEDESAREEIEIEPEEPDGAAAKITDRQLQE